MAPPIQFRVMTATGVELIISRGTSPTGAAATAIEGSTPTLRRIDLFNDRGVFLIYPDIPKAFDTNYRRENAERFLKDHIDCGEHASDANVSREDSVSRWITYETEDKRTVTLRVNKVSNLLEGKKIVDSSNVVRRELKISDVVKNQQWDSSFFDVPSTAIVQVLKNHEEATAEKGKLMLDSIPGMARIEIPRHTKDPETGRIIIPGPRGLGAEFQKMFEEKFSKVIAEKMPKSREASDELEQTVSDQTNSTSTHTVPLTKTSASETREFSVWWVVPGILVFAILVFMVVRRPFG